VLFLAEFLKARIISERIEHWIEPEQRGSERGSCPKSFRSIVSREQCDLGFRDDLDEWERLMEAAAGLVHSL
jgi:hypothetical protein